MPIGDLIREAAAGQRGEDQKRIADVGLEWVELLLKKNADYGSSVWKVPILAPDCPVSAAIRVRMSDKISRINNLVAGGKDTVGESLDDSLKDLCAYGLLYLARPKEQKQEVT